MDINKLLKGVKCECGRHHTCDIDYVFIEENAILRLTDICKNYNSILLVADQNTFTAAGSKTEAALCGKIADRVIFSGKKILVPNEDATNTVMVKNTDKDLIIGIGSGVIQDLCKYVSFKSGIPYMVVATAPSMDGYASDGAAMILGGMKETVKAGLPRAIIADTFVLADAPLDMIKAGYGDIIGKYSALNDWELSATINGEYFCRYIYDLTLGEVLKTLNLADGLLKRNPQSVKALMEALVVIGILMSFAGSSRPASGSEHHLSHFFEITGIIDSTEYFAHGIDVGYSTVITSKIRERLLANPFPKKINRPDYKKAVKEIYTRVADGCLTLQEKVGNYDANRLSVYLEKEAEIKSILRKVPTAAEIEKMLGLVELNIDEFYNFYQDKKIKNAVNYAKDLKDRYTVLWLNYDLYGEA